MIVNKAYRYRIYPTTAQKMMFAKTFGCVRFIYNKMLSDRIDYYKETGQKLNNTPISEKKPGEYQPDVIHKIPWVARESTPVERV